jgi:hypothetical protein
MKKTGIKKLLFILVVCVCAAPFFINGKEGKPLLTIDKVKRHVFALFSDKKMEKYEPDNVETEILSPDSIVPESGEPVVKIYKFRDENGVQHFADKKPNRKDYEIMYLPVSEKEGGLDMIRKKIVELKKKAEAVISSKKDKTKKNEQSSLLQDYSDPGKVIQDAKNVRKQVAETYEQRDDLINGENK